MIIFYEHGALHDTLHTWAAHGHQIVNFNMLQFWGMRRDGQPV